MDGDKGCSSWEDEFGLAVTCHHPNLRTYGNWYAALWELFVRNPDYDRYAIFQDDFVTSKNLLKYLDACEYPTDGYWNLYTFPSNQKLASKTKNGGTVDGWYLSNQWGRGAVGLVFNKERVLQLLSSRHMAERPMDARRGHKAVDGAVVTALKKVGVREYVHSPSLIQHTGAVSSMGNEPHLQAVSYRGPDFDCLTLLDAGLVQ